MDINETLSQLTSLPVTDRLRVVESLWDSIESDTPVSATSEQRAEINRRIKAHETNPDSRIIAPRCGPPPSVVQLGTIKSGTTKSGTTQTDAGAGMRHQYRKTLEKNHASKNSATDRWITVPEFHRHIDCDQRSHPRDGNF